MTTIPPALHSRNQIEYGNHQRTDPPARPGGDREEPLSRHQPDEGWQRVYGGQVIGQALVAASRTVPKTGAPTPARLFSAPGRHHDPDPLYRGSHPRRPQLHHPAGGGRAARPRHLQHVHLFPDRRGRLRPPDARCRKRRGPDNCGRAELREEWIASCRGVCRSFTASGRSRSAQWIRWTFSPGEAARHSRCAG